MPPKGVLKSLKYQEFTREGDSAKHPMIRAYHGAELPYVFNTHAEWMTTTNLDNEITDIITDYWTNFAKTGGKDILSYVEKRTYPGPVMNGMLVYMADNQAKGSDAAIEFLKKHEDVWSKWVSGGAKKKIKAGL